MTVYLSSLPVALHSVEKESVPVVLHETDGTVQCGIFQEACSRVEIDGALATWETGERSYDCLELPCEHKFNACALALHFLTNYMTCPVCRNGLRSKMSLECGPENVKRTYEQHITAQEYTELLEFEPEAFLRDLREAVQHVLSSDDKLGGKAAIYGMTSGLPAGPVNTLLKAYNDVVLKL
jgi:hypothetical protein